MAVKAIANRYPGKCATCGQEVASGKGMATKVGRGWRVTHLPVRLVWDPTVPGCGRYVDGCPGDSRVTEFGR